MSADGVALTTTAITGVSNSQPMGRMRHMLGLPPPGLANGGNTNMSCDDAMTMLI